MVPSWMSDEENSKARIVAKPKVLNDTSIHVDV